MLEQSPFPFSLTSQFQKWPSSAASRFRSACRRAQRRWWWCPWPPLAMSSALLRLLLWPRPPCLPLALPPPVAGALSALSRRLLRRTRPRLRVCRCFGALGVARAVLGKLIYLETSIGQIAALNWGLQRGLLACIVRSFLLSLRAPWPTYCRFRTAPRPSWLT